MVSSNNWTSNKEEFAVRLARESDLRNVAEIESVCFPSDRLLGLAELESLVHQRETSLLVSEGFDSHLLGFVCSVAEGSLEHIISIAVKQAARRQGVATGLLSAAVESADSRGARLVYAEIRESNKASQSLFHGLGFAVRETICQYYTNPDEDAFVVQLNLSISDRKRVQNEAVTL